MRHILCAAAIALASVSSATAQKRDEIPPAPQSGFGPGAGERSIPAEEWRERVDGRTVYYEIDGALHGREYYEPNSNNVVFIFANGQCDEGVWSEENGVYCYDFGGQHCFYQFERGDEIIIREVLSGAEQRVSQITDERLSCSPEIISDLAPLERVLPVFWAVDADEGATE